MSNPEDINFTIHEMPDAPSQEVLTGNARQLVSYGLLYYRNLQDISTEDLTTTAEQEQGNGGKIILATSSHTEAFVSFAEPDGTMKTFEYDANGPLTVHVTDHEGIIRRHVYDDNKDPRLEQQYSMLHRAVLGFSGQLPPKELI